jgi:hypothetical protein
MAKKELKDVKIDIEKDNNNTKMWFSDLLTICINTPPPQSGFSGSAMRTRLAILDAIDDGKGKTMKFPDDHAKVIKDAVSEFKWIQLHKDIVAFIDAVEAM